MATGMTVDGRAAHRPAAGQAPVTVPEGGDASAGRASKALMWGAVAYSALFLLWSVLTAPSPQRQLLSDLAPLPIGLVAWMAAWWAGRRAGTDTVSRNAWQRVAGSFLLWWLGDLLWFTQEVVLRRPPFPSPADLCYLLSYPVLAWGLLSLPGAPRRRSDRIRVGLDAVTVVLAGSMVIWYLVVGPSIRNGSDLVATVLNVAYPVGDLVLLFGVAVVLLGREGRNRWLWLLLGGVTALVAADVAYARLSLSDSYAGGDWPDTFWMWAQCLFVMAALHQGRRPDRAAGEMDVRVGGVSNLPYGAALLGYGLLFFVGRDHASYPLNGLLVGAGAITAVVMARQIRVSRENARLLYKLHELAEIDGLTSILNRRSFLEAGERLLTGAARVARPLTVLMIDVDHFKSVNDTFGHAAGDGVLAEVATRTMGQLRETDVVGRYGGDEVAVVMPDCDLGEGLEVAERIRRAVSASPVVTADRSVRVSLSVGVAEADGSADLTAVLARADAALYRAKEAGRDCTRSVA